MISAYILVPSLTLLAIAIIIFIIAGNIIIIYRDIGEPIFIHVAIIFIFLFLTFFSGAIGVYLSLDQLEHPLFLFNVFVISMTYVGTGLIYRNLTHDNSVGLDYLILLLLLAPAYSLAMILGLEFSIIPALSSQFIPLIICFVLESRIYKRVNSIEITKGENEDILIKSLKFVFQAARFAHFLGILAMIGFAILVIFGQEIQAEAIWSDTWLLFDFIYYIALLLLLFVFLIILFYLLKARKPILEANTAFIINSLIQ